MPPGEMPSAPICQILRSEMNMPAGCPVSALNLCVIVQLKHSILNNQLAWWIGKPDAETFLHGPEGVTTPNPI